MRPTSSPSVVTAYRIEPNSRAIAPASHRGHFYDSYLENVLIECLYIPMRFPKFDPKSINPPTLLPAKFLLIEPTIAFFRKHTNLPLAPHPDIRPTRYDLQVNFRFIYRISIFHYRQTLIQVRAN